MRSFAMVFIIVLFSRFCFGQTDATIHNSKRDEESFYKLEDGIIKREIAFFTIAGSVKTGTDGFPKMRVREIPLVGCTDSSAYFRSGDIVSTNIFVNIQSARFDTTGHMFSYSNSQQPFLTAIDKKPFWGTDGGMPKKKISLVHFIHVKYSLTLPKSAIEGLYEPNFCPIGNSDKKTRQEKPKKLLTIPCKVFRSEDKRRVYIYMLNSDGAGGYEVTWVIQDSKYYTRVIDNGF